MSAHIRKAVRGDLPALIRLYNELSLDDPREDPSAMREYETALAAIEKRPDHHVLVAEEDGAILGSVTVIIEPNLTYQARPFALIENVVVTESARGAGIGALIMKEAIDIARRAGCYKLTLTSNKRRADAHRFYEGLGFNERKEGFQLRLK